MQLTVTNRSRAYPKVKGRRDVDVRKMCSVLRVHEVLIKEFGQTNEVILDSSAVEHSAVNRRVVGSNPTRGVWLLGQAVKTSPFHGGNTGSIPVGVIRRHSQAVRRGSATP